jgi:1,4-alpha-glucan branching enzyme
LDGVFSLRRAAFVNWSIAMVACDTATADRLNFRIYLPHAEHVDLVGSFTDWQDKPVRMRRGHGEEGGWWSAACKVPEGDHEFAYLVDGNFWMPDYAASGVKRNELGRWTSGLSVHPEPPERFGRGR